MPVADVIKALEAYKIKSISRYLVLRGDEVSHYVIVYFKEGKVVFMEYFTPP
jgi:5,10-methylenetetrahydrofolate reductase